MHSGSTKEKGFTLIELVIVITVTGILSGIGVPRYLGFMERARIENDRISIRILNTATNIYAIDREVQDGDVFQGIVDDEQRQQELVDSGWLEEIVYPQQNDSEFKWHMESQRWINTLYELALNDQQHFYFSLLDPEEFNKVGTWGLDENGFTATNGLLCIENNRSEYTITLKAALAHNNERGGYGILFDTVLTKDNKDTGYVVQFDRGYGGIIIRERTGGRESNPVLAVTSTQNGFIPSSKRDEWWTTEKDIRIVVKQIKDKSGWKEMDFWIDDVKIIEGFTFESSVEPVNSFTGFRSWHDETLYSELHIR